MRTLKTLVLAGALGLSLISCPFPTPNPIPTLEGIVNVNLDKSYSYSINILANNNIVGGINKGQTGTSFSLIPNNYDIKATGTEYVNTSYGKIPIYHFSNDVGISINAGQTYQVNLIMN